ncbi:DUF1643 domain-containing protein [Pseudomonas monachiensis]|uniref:DUF1643 domain-containing protein n=1 Tax=Pseudomonas monachiensis TaxID=3060212 RepID=A0ABW9HA88_9PSED
MSKFVAADFGSAAPLPKNPVDALVEQRTFFNDDRTHRFTLFRHWGNPEHYACGISMNPSGAAEEGDDPTVDRMIRRAMDLGFGAYYQLNVMSIRGTDSSHLATASEVNLSENDDHIRRIAARAGIVIVSWGNAGHKRGLEVEKILREVCDPAKVFCLGLNQNGSPVHPLYQKKNARLLPYIITPRP